MGERPRRRIYVLACGHDLVTSSAAAHVPWRQVEWGYGTNLDLLRRGGVWFSRMTYFGAHTASKYVHWQLGVSPTVNLLNYAFRCVELALLSDLSNFELVLRHCVRLRCRGVRRHQYSMFEMTTGASRFFAWMRGGGRGGKYGRLRDSLKLGEATMRQLVILREGRRDQLVRRIADIMRQVRYTK